MPRFGKGMMVVAVMMTVAMAVVVAVVVIMIVVMVGVVFGHASIPVVGSAMCSNMVASMLLMWASAAA